LAARIDKPFLPRGVRLCALPVAEINTLYAKSTSFDARELKQGHADLLAGFRGGLYDIELDARLGEATQFELTVRVTDVRWAFACFGRPTARWNRPWGTLHVSEVLPSDKSLLHRGKPGGGIAVADQ